MSRTPTPISNRISDIHPELGNGLDSKSARSETTSGSDIQVVEEKKTSVKDVVIKLTVSSLCGIVFGICLEKGRVFEPTVIRHQMVFESFIMLKMFLAATASSQLCLSILSLIPQTKEQFHTAAEEFVCGFINKGILTSILGPFILGMGMTMAGTCPGMVLAQVGVWIPNAIFTFLGVLLGVLTYGLCEPYISRVTKPSEPYKNTHVWKTFKKPYILFSVPMTLLLVVCIVLLEYFWSWEKDTKRIHRENHTSNVVTATSWPPSVAGAIIGLIQIPIVLVLKDTLGGSSSYVTIVSQWTVTDSLQKKFPYLAKKRWGISNWWQVFYVVFAIVGALISGASSNTLATGKGVPIYFALIGGFIMMWGARLGSGCTSGHGLSGLALLAWLSLVAVPAMFAGGITLAFIMQATGALENFVELTGQV